MTLKRNLHFIISPNQALHERLNTYVRQTGQQDDVTLRRKVIWQKDFTTYSLAYHETQVKLLFLAEIHTQALDVPEPYQQYQDFLLELLGSTPYTVETFDRWWQIDILADDVYKFTDMEDQVERRSIAHLADAHPEVNSWLGKITSEHETVKP